MEHIADIHSLNAHRDARLVARIRQGDERAFTELVARFSPQLLAHARRMVGGHHDAEDIVQDAFVRAHRALCADEREIALASWLHTIVRNRALDRLRQDRPAASFDDVAYLLPSGPASDPQHAAESREALGGLVSGLRSLSERQRAALVLHELEGVTHADIGRRLGVSEAASKTLVHRARRGLRRSYACA